MRRVNLNLVLGFVTFFFVTNAISQSSVTIDASQNMTNFAFTNSQGERDEDYNPNFSGSYSLGYRYQFDFGMFAGAKIGMRKAGASLIYDDANYSWDFQYFDARLNLGYQYDFDRLSAYFAVSPYFGYMLRATQTLNHEDYDIINSGDLEKSDFGLFFSPGAKYRINDFVSIYGQFNYMLGLQNIETVEAQKSQNRLMGLTLGLAFDIK